MPLLVFTMVKTMFALEAVLVFCNNVRTSIPEDFEGS